MDKYQNIHTGDVREVVKVEIVSNPPITVYVFDNGDHWNQELLNENWKKVSDEEK